MQHTISFDTVEYVHELKKAGVPEKQAEAQAHALIKVVDNNLASKQDIFDLKRDIKEMELKLGAKIADSNSEIIKWNVGTVFVAVGLFATIMKLLG